MTHFISHSPALERRMTNVTQQMIFFFFFGQYSCSRSKTGLCLWTHSFHTYPEIFGVN